MEGRAVGGLSCGVHGHGNDDAEDTQRSSVDGMQVASGAGELTAAAAAPRHPGGGA